MKITNQINANEKILWKGKQAMIVSLLKSFLNPFLPIMVVWDLFMRIIYLGMAESEWVSLVTKILVLLYFLVAAVRMVKSRSVSYLVSDYAVYKQTGIVTTNIITKPIADFTQVSVSQSLFDKIAGTGDVKCECIRPAYTENGNGSYVIHIDNISEYEQVFKYVKGVVK